MGCCSSSLDDQDLLTTTENYHNITNNNNDYSTSTTILLPGAYYNKSRPFKRVGLMWTSDTPLTITQLEQKRFLYWETAPNYGGRIEIWQALQVAFSESDVIMARSILEAANVILPTGNPCEGCFDELGNQYDIPIYCIVPPTNLCLTDDDDDDYNMMMYLSLPVNKQDSATFIIQNQSIYSSTSTSDHLVPTPDCSENPFSIIVRLSTEKDIKLTISSNNETIGSLRSRIFDATVESGIHADTHILRLIYLGRILKDTMSIVCDESAEVDVEQTFAKKGSVRVAKDSIIQALVATKKQN